MWPPAYDDAGIYLSESLSSLPGGDYYADITGLVEVAANGENPVWSCVTLIESDTIEPLARNGYWRTHYV